MSCKTCPCCGRAWDGTEMQARWGAQGSRVQDVEAGLDPIAEPAYQLQLIECECGSTLAIEIPAA